MVAEEAAEQGLVTTVEAAVEAAAAAAAAGRGRSGCEQQLLAAEAAAEP